MGNKIEMDRFVLRRMIQRDVTGLEQAIDRLGGWALDPRTAKMICDMDDRIAGAKDSLEQLRQTADHTFLTRGPIES